jgi:uncharacterized protein
LGAASRQCLLPMWSAMLQARDLAAMPNVYIDAYQRKLLCDEMLQRLGRWLRAAGYDTLIADGGKWDRDLLVRAVRERRILVTRDRKLPEHRGAMGWVIVLRANDLEGCVAEISEQLRIDWLLKPFTRCVVCNTELAPLPPALRSAIPQGLSSQQADLRHCPLCWKVYWSGGHVDRMRRRLEGWQQLHADPEKNSSRLRPSGDGHRPASPRPGA